MGNSFRGSWVTVLEVLGEDRWLGGQKGRD